ncbi:MAG: DUF190 domain-containing protein [Legionellaceae bacterium]|nr:DUF190 domain-containing protein [Legionellaceae bacterium]
MKTMSVVFVRVYITESSGLLKTIVKYLKEEVGIRGISVFRAISGFGEDGEHNMSLMALSLDLPLVVEFFDEKVKTDRALEYLYKEIKHEHIVFWDAKSNN